MTKPDERRGTDATSAGARQTPSGDVIGAATVGEPSSGPGRDFDKNSRGVGSSSFKETLQYPHPIPPSPNPDPLVLSLLQQNRLTMEAMMRQQESAAVRHQSIVDGMQRRIDSLEAFAVERLSKCMT